MSETAKRFFKAFQEAHAAEYDRDPERLFQTYDSLRGWTGYMESLIPGVLRTCLGNGGEGEDAGVDVLPEFRTFDWAARKAHQLRPGYSRLPADIEILVEHENGRYPYQEFWKLLHWRCRTKVLITYSRRPTELIRELDELRSDCARFNPGNEQECYLVILGDQTNPQRSFETKTLWRGWTCTNSSKLKPVEMTAP